MTLDECLSVCNEKLLSSVKQYTLWCTNVAFAFACVICFRSHKSVEFFSALQSGRCSAVSHRAAALQEQRGHACVHAARVLSLAVNAVAHFCGRRLHRFCVRLSSFDCRFTCIPTASPFCTTCALQAGSPQLFISAFYVFCVACGERQQACDMRRATRDHCLTRFVEQSNISPYRLIQERGRICSTKDHEHVRQPSSSSTTLHLSHVYFNSGLRCLCGVTAWF